MSVDWTDGHTVREPGVGQFVGVGQFSSVSGKMGSSGTVVNTVNVEMGQGQIVSGPRPYPR